MLVYGINVLKEVDKKFTNIWQGLLKVNEYRTLIWYNTNSTN